MNTRTEKWMELFPGQCNLRKFFQLIMRITTRRNQIPAHILINFMATDMYPAIVAG